MRPDPRPGHQRLCDVPEARRRELQLYVQRRLAQMRSAGAETLAAAYEDSCGVAAPLVVRGPEPGSVNRP